MLPNHLEARDIATSAPASHAAPGSQFSRRHGLTVLVFALAALTLSACGGSGSTNPPASRPSTTVGSPSTPTSKPSVALPPTTTPATEAPTTAVPSTSTTPTTEAPTTTVPPASTPTTEAPTTTVPPTTTPSTGAPTTTTPIAEPSTSSPPWGWIVIGILLLAGLVVALVLWLRSRSRRAALVAWSHSAGPASQQAAVARDLLSGDRANVDAERRDAVRSQVETAAQALDGLVTSAPDDTSRRAASSAAAALRGLMFADEADRLLHSRQQAPTADELAQADETLRARVRELDDALEELTKQVRPEVAEPPAAFG